ncbi:patatin-like phospholipase family protein [Curvibacter sp. CHRR-16]|nr:patatin-like phospholipase family protein [Curvibacter sp. CHRR-16]MBT0571512.1 patatin-like phospholipase family protein [Curvibacter sp. CHRR-16]
MSVSVFKRRFGAALFFCVVVLAGCSTAPSADKIANSSTVSAIPAQPIVRTPPKVGLALGGGAARGFAHVGVIQVLEENGITPNLVAGTSAGSLVAALYASGKTGRQLQQVAEGMDESTIADWTLPLFNRGLLRGEALAKFVNNQVGNKLMEEMPVPLGILATDLSTGNEVLFRRGDTGTAVRASSSVPGVFQPVKIAGHDYVDGGLVAPVPVSAARKMGADLVIAVDISSPPEGAPTNGTLEVLLQTFTIMGKSINQFELQKADVVVRPVLTGIGSSDFTARKRSIEAGRQAMLKALPELRAAIDAKTK